MAGYSGASTSRKGLAAMATKAQQNAALIEAISIRMDDAGVPEHADVIERVQILIDAKTDVEKDLAFANASPAGSIVDEIVAILDEADVDGGSVQLRVANLIADAATLRGQLEQAEDFLEPNMNEDDARALSIVHGNILPVMVKSVVDKVMRLKVSPQSLGEEQQRQFILSITNALEAQFSQAVRVLAAGEHPVVRATLIDTSTKGTTTKIKLEATKTVDTAVALAKVGEGMIDLVFVDLEVLNDGNTPMVKPVPDQPTLPLEKAADLTGPAGDQDLVDAADPAPEAEVPINDGGSADIDWSNDRADEDDIIPLASDEDDEQDHIDPPAPADVDQRQREEETN